MPILARSSRESPEGTRITFVFDALGDEGAITMAGAAAPQELATRMHADWVRFAETCDPGWPRSVTMRSCAATTP